jgi:hypothetical protein
LVLNVEAFQPPTVVVFRCHQVEILHLRSHEVAKASRLIVGLALHAENPLPKRPMGIDPQEALAQRDEAHNLQYCVGGQVMQLYPICEKKASVEVVPWK